MKSKALFFSRWKQALLLGWGAAQDGSVWALDLDLQFVSRYVATRGHVAVSGQYAYCWGDALDVIDLSNPAQPKLAHRYDTSHWLYGLPASTNFTYVPNADETWMVYDASNPADPQRVGGYKTIASARRGSPHATVSGAYAYVTYATASTTALQIMDLRDPANPQPIGSYDPGQFPRDVAISGTFAYLTADDGLHIIDISNPKNPVRQSVLSGLGGSVAVSSNYAFVGGSVVDIRDPAKPRLVAQLQGDATEIALAGNYACLGGNGDMVLFDISDPIHPKFAGRGGSDEYTAGVALKGRYAYFMGSWSGLQVFEMRPANPQQLDGLQFGTTHGEHGPGGMASSVAVAGNCAIVADRDSGLHTLDIRDPGSARPVGGYGSRSEVSGIAVSGNYAYISGTVWNGNSVVEAGLGVLDISDSTHPQRVAGVSFDGYLSRPVISGHYAYVTGFKYDAAPQVGRLWIFDLSNPIAPRQVASYRSTNSSGFPNRSVVAGPYAYLAMLGNYNGTNYIGGGGLEVVNVSNPLTPHGTGFYDAGGHVRDVAVSGHYALVAVEDGAGTGTDTVTVIDIAYPANPRRVGAYSGAFSEVAISGNIAYAGGTHGLEAIDIRDPARPQRVGGNSAIKPPNGIRQIAVAGGRVFVAAAELGLVTLDLFRPFELQPLPSTTSGTFGLRLTGPRGLTVRLQRSTDLLGWETWQSISLSGGAADIADIDATATPNRWYRAVGQ